MKKNRKVNNAPRKAPEIPGDIDLQLNGRPVNLSLRPAMGSGRASVRSYSVSGMSQRRSVSAVPSFQSQTELNVRKPFGWQRPQSADQSNRESVTAGIKFPAQNFDNLKNRNKNQCFVTCTQDGYKSKHYSFDEPLSLSSMTDDTDQSNFNTSKYSTSLQRKQEQETDYQDVFGSTYTLPDMLERTWTEEDLIRYCDEAESLYSDEHCQSEMSLGGRILTLAQCQDNRYSIPEVTNKPSNPLGKVSRLTSFGSAESVLSSRLQRVERETDLLLKQLARGAICADSVDSVGESDCVDDFSGNRKYESCQDRILSSFSQRTSTLFNTVANDNHLHKNVGNMTQFASRNVLSFDASPDVVLMKQTEINLLQPDTCRFGSSLEAQRSTEDLQMQLFSGNQNMRLTDSTEDVSPHLLRLPKSPQLLPSSLRNDSTNELPNPDNTLASSSQSSRESAASSEQNSHFFPTARCMNEEQNTNNYHEQLQVVGPSSTKKLQYEPKFVSNASDLDNMQLVPTKLTSSQTQGMHSSPNTYNDQNMNNSQACSPKMATDSAQPQSSNVSAFQKKLSPNNSYTNMLMLIDLDEAVKEPENSALASQEIGPSKATYEELVDVFQDFQPPTTMDTILCSGVMPEEAEYKDIVNNFIKDNSIEAGQCQTSMETVLSSAEPSEYAARQSISDNVSTYDDIVNILNVLELEGKPSDENNMCTETISTLLQTHINTNVLSNCKSPDNTGHLSEILTYLDHVDKSSVTVLDNAINSVKFIRENSSACDPRSELSVKLEDLLSMNIVDLAHMVFTLRFQMEDKAKSVKALKMALEEEREARQHAENDAERNMKSRLREQKDHYESAVSRHQKFIDQLISDKKALTEKVENMVSEMKSIEERHAKNLKIVQERHAVEVKRAKDTQAATNKLRMDSWINTKTKKIKEMTVKGLEPELVRMTTSHQQELAEVRQLHQHELKEAELRAARKTEANMELLRHQLLQEKEEAVAKERELLRQRLEKQAEQEEMMYQEHRHRLLNEVKREKQRLQQDLIAAQQDSDKAVQRLKQEQQDAIDAISRRHVSEMRKVKESMEAEREAWARDYKKQKDVEINAREIQYRDELRRERDQQIEGVIDRLTEETTQAKADLEHSYNNKMKKLKEQFESDLKETEDCEQAAKAKYNKLKAQMTDVEDTVTELKVMNRQLEKDLKEERKMSEMFSTERSQIKEVLRQEFSSQIVSLEQELTKVRAELATVKTKYDVELNTLRTVKDHELNAVYSRVKNTIAQRDTTITELKGKCGQLEGLVEAQRKEYLIK